MEKIGLNAVVFTIVTLIGFYIGAFVEHVSYFTPPSLEVGQTVAFLVLAYSSILHVFNVRSSKSILK